MKWLIDANLPLSLATKLRKSGQDAMHLSEIGASSATDLDLRELALDSRRHLLTRDRSLVGLWPGNADALLVLVELNGVADPGFSVRVLDNLPELERRLDGRSGVFRLTEEVLKP